MEKSTEKHIPKIVLGCYPTPLQELENASRYLGAGRKLYIKRDDLIGIGFGGNKVRKMEYLLAQAREEGCDCIVTGGGSRSNQPLAAAACAAKAGLQAHIVYTKDQDTVSRKLGRLLGAAEHVADGSDKPNLMRDIRKTAAELKRQGRSPYIIPPGAASPLAALGYADMVEELAAQAKSMGITLDHIICCGATGNTYAGIVLGTKRYCPGTKATAVAIGRRFSHPDTLCRQARAAAKLRGWDADLSEEDFHTHFSCGKGASYPTEGGREAMQAMASSEGIFLDPYFTGKAFRGLQELNRTGTFAKGETIVFIHTGGLAVLMNSL